MLGNFSCFFRRLLIVSSSTGLKSSFRDRSTITVAKSLDPDQARHFVGLIWVQTVCKDMLGNFSCFFCRLLIYFKINFFKKKIYQECHWWQRIWIQIRPDILSGLIWVQTVYKVISCHWQAKSAILYGSEWLLFHCKSKSINVLCTRICGDFLRKSLNWSLPMKSKRTKFNVYLE